MGEDASDPVVFLHGDLDLKIIEARRLPNMDLMADRLRRCFTVFDVCKAACTRGKKKNDKIRGFRGEIWENISANSFKVK
ncbi:hypothetical protein V6Z12_D10G157700 [Gossypium hirsutum]